MFAAILQGLAEQRQRIQVLGVVILGEAGSLPYVEYTMGMTISFTYSCK